MSLELQREQALAAVGKQLPGGWPLPGGPPRSLNPAVERRRLQKHIESYCVSQCALTVGIHKAVHGGTWEYGGTRRYGSTTKWQYVVGWPVRGVRLWLYKDDVRVQDTSAIPVDVPRVVMCCLFCPAAAACLTYMHLYLCVSSGCSCAPFNWLCQRVCQPSAPALFLQPAAAADQGGQSRGCDTDPAVQ